MYTRLITILTLVVGFWCATLFSTSAETAIMIEVPPVAVTETGQSLVLSNVTFDAISLSGISATDPVTLTISAGTLTLAQTTGLTFTAGDGTDDTTMTFSGDEAAINAAFDGLTMTPPAAFAGRLTLNVATDGASVLLNIAVNTPIDGEAARDALLNGVTQIHGAVQPGNLAAFGATAYTINQFSDGNSWIAVSSYGRGRVVAMPDHQAIAMDRWADEGETAQFYKNALAWLNQSEHVTPTIVTYDQGTADWLMAEGYTATVKTDTNGLIGALNSADIFVSSVASSQTPENIAALQNFALNGGGLFIADYGVGYDWWWNKPFYEAPANLILREAGIVYGSDWHWGNGLFDATLRASGQVNANALLAMLVDESGFSTAEQEQAGLLMIQMFDGLPPNDPLLQQLDAQFYARINDINPTPATPVSDPFEQALLTREAAILQRQDPFAITAHRTISDTYGAIASDAPRVTKTVPINTSRTRFQFTGLYAAPGEVVTVTVPAELVGNGYLVRLGTNTDNISARDDWRRVPYIHRSFEIENSVIPVASAFGGAVIIDLRGNVYSEAANIGIQNVTIENAVEQPYFVLGEHTNQQWLDTLRDKPAVRAALVSTHTIITVPSSYVATLDDPETLMAWWDDVTAGQDDLVGRQTPRTAAEIINVDIQNSAGAAHSGYPIQAWDIHWGNPADMSRLETGSWGDFHELGHNHQRGWWTFDGDGEVSVNIFSNFNLETDVANAGSGGWGYSRTEADSITRARSDIAGGGTYSDKSNRWSFWFLLGDVDGRWENYRCAFRTYEEDNVNNPDALPDNNLEEQAQWLVRFSTCAGYDLSPFMVDLWGLEVDQASLDAVSHLPDYLPIASELGELDVVSAEALPIDLVASAITMDDITTVASVGNVANGTLTDLGNGAYEYVSDYEFAGVDTFTYTLQTSVGNIKTFTATINVSLNGARLETWRNIDGTSVDLLRADPDFPDSPDEIDLLDKFEAPTGRGSDFGARMRAVLVPAVTGEYVFWIASDDDGELWFSPNTDPHAAQLIASVDGWTDSQEWDKYASQRSITQTLVAGERYYIEALMKENGGGDNLAVGWTTPTITQTTVISSAYLQQVELGQSPTAQDDMQTTDEDTPLSFAVLGNDSDPENDALVVGTAQAANGVAVIQIDGSLVYTPSADFNGTDTITYTIGDKYAGSDTGVVTMTVNAINDAPRGEEKWFEIYAGSADNTFIGTINATDPDGDALALAITDGDPDGAFMVDNTGAISVANGAALTIDQTYTLTITLNDGARAITSVPVVIEVFGCADGLTVSNSADSGPCTLRDILAHSSDDDVIALHSRLTDRTIILDGVVYITNSVTIDGGTTGITIDGNQDEIFDISSNQTVTLENLNITGGRSNSGAMIVRWSSRLIISNTTFYGNHSTQYSGGAIHAQGRVTIYNSTFSGNTASNGGALGLRGGGNYIYNSTFVDNGGTATIAIDNATGMEIFNTIISSTVGAGCQQPALIYTGTLAHDTSCGGTTRTVVSDFKLSPLQGDGIKVHTPHADSPVINAGDTATCLTVDQLGNPRNDGACDVGSVEFQGVPTAVSLTSMGAARHVWVMLLLVGVVLLSAETYRRILRP